MVRFHDGTVICASLPDGDDLDDDNCEPQSEETRGACVTTVLAAGNYPDAPRTGDPITLPAAADGIFVFHAGTARHADGRLVTSGGRVIAVSATGETVAIAQQRSLEYARRVEFRGKQLRTDIGWREIAREQERAHAGTARN